MSATTMTHAIMFGAMSGAVTELSVLGFGPDDELPEELRQALARLRLLEGVPFSHLVPDAELLPPESVRFFHVDREWTDALVEGALSVGTHSSLDRDQLEAVHTAVRGVVDSEERRVRVPGGPRPALGPGGPITGLLLRSAAVSGWPALHVRAWSTDVPDDIPADTPAGAVRLLRLERLAPAVLLCLFDGVPRVIHIEEPRAGVQLGVDLQPGAEGTTGAQVRLRDAQTGAPLLDGGNPRTVEVPFRQGAPGVVHVHELAARVAAVPEVHVTTGTTADVDSAELAMQLLQFPFRQVFGPQPGISILLPEIFRPTIGMDTVVGWYQGGVP